jgi:predicted CXXCH cytochrome family protein
MKKLLVAAALALFATTASAAIAGGSHDMASAYVAGKYGAATLGSCAMCHAPHLNAGQVTATPMAGGPLWNRAQPAPAGGYAIYNSGTLSAVAQTGKALGPNSYTCLACHDGVSDMGATVVGTQGWAAATQMTGFAVVGTALSNDHPVGIAYNTLDTTLQNAPTPGTPTATTVGLYAGRVECGSCHDPHGLSNQLSGGASFLRVSATIICAACHLK